LTSASARPIAAPTPLPVPLSDEDRIPCTIAPTPG
jgi:hypothetical protein